MLDVLLDVTSRVVEAVVDILTLEDVDAKVDVVVGLNVDMLTDVAFDVGNVDGVVGASKLLV